MTIIFFGSDDFAAVNLEELLNSRHRVIGCVTHPDKPKGRKMKVSASPVKEYALKHKLPLCQPADIRDQGFQEQLKDWNADLFVVIAYGYILPKEILALPKKFAINVHASLLPEYRGAAPINRAILDGKDRTGVSIIRLNSKMDAGDILATAVVHISPHDTAVSLKTKLADAATGLLAQTIDRIESGDQEFEKQDEAKVTYAPKLDKKTGAIDWSRPSAEIHDLVRGLIPWPCAYTRFRGKALKILAAEVVAAETGEYTPGEIIEIQKESFVVATGENALAVLRIHPENSKAMDARSFMAGHEVKVGDVMEKPE